MVILIFVLKFIYSNIPKIKQLIYVKNMPKGNVFSTRIVIFQLKTLFLDAFIYKKSEKYITITYI